MWSFGLSLLPVLALASHASASSLVARNIPQLLARQTAFDPSIIPAACQNTCVILVSTVQTCVPPQPATCGCTLNEERGFVTCLNCILGAGAPTQEIIDNVQSFVDQYVILCNRAGAPLPATTVNGGTSLVTSTAVSVSGTRSASGVQPSITLSRSSSATFTSSEEEFNTTPTRVAPQSTFSAAGSDTTSSAGGGPLNIPSSGSNVAPRTEMWLTAVAAAGVAFVAFL